MDEVGAPPGRLERRPAEVGAVGHLVARAQLDRPAFRRAVAVRPTLARPVVGVALGSPVLIGAAQRAAAPASWVVRLGPTATIGGDRPHVLHELTEGRAVPEDEHRARGRRARRDPRGPAERGSDRPPAVGQPGAARSARSGRPAEATDRPVPRDPIARPVTDGRPANVPAPVPQVDARLASGLVAVPRAATRSGQRERRTAGADRPKPYRRRRRRSTSTWWPRPPGLSSCRTRGSGRGPPTAARPASRRCQEVGQRCPSRRSRGGSNRG